VGTDREPTGEVADPQALRHVFGAFATGVTVVTVGGAQPHGMTANSFTTVSIDPPLVLICVERTAVMHHALPAMSRFAVSILGSRQEDVARHFADRQRPLGAAQFDGVDTLPGRHTTAPLIAGALTHVECELWRRYDGGDHSIFVGRVLGLDRVVEEGALVFCRGRFGRLTIQRSEVS
jgi:flavin reductase